MAGARRAVIQPATGSACRWRIRTWLTGPSFAVRCNQSLTVKLNDWVALPTLLAALIVKV
jgi:hypothetical protein